MNDAPDRRSGKRTNNNDAVWVRARFLKGHLQSWELQPASARENASRMGAQPGHQQAGSLPRLQQGNPRPRKAKRQDFPFYGFSGSIWVHSGYHDLSAERATAAGNEGQDLFDRKPIGKPLCV
jgi:diadenosine tetraphosphatase ApaH/serine/threonine PP2A family protein phosphatase